MAIEDEMLFVENIVAVDVPTNNSNIENVHLEPSNLLENVVCNL
jgi:hypothetical protein